MTGLKSQGSSAARNEYQEKNFSRSHRLATISPLERDVERTNEHISLGCFLSKPLTEGVLRNIVAQPCREVGEEAVGQ